MSRQKTQHDILSHIEEDVRNGKKWSEIILSATKEGKNTWTRREVYNATMHDICLENGVNPIDYYRQKS